MKTHTTPKYLSLAEAAIYCSLSERTLRRLIASGEMPHYRPCRSVRVSITDLEDFMDKSRNEIVTFGELAAIQ